MIKRGSEGKDVEKIQKRLDQVGFPPGKIDGKFGPATESAVINFQLSEGLLPDGIVGPRMVHALFSGENLIVDPKNIPSAVEVTSENVISEFTEDVVSEMFEADKKIKKNIKENLPPILEALEEQGLTDKKIVLAALSITRAETEAFKPLDEEISSFNTSPGGHPFDRYDNRKDLGNQGKPDGGHFKGRGFIQIRGRTNYTRYSNRLGILDQLVQNPDLANEVPIAAKILAFYLKDRELRIKNALLRTSYREARYLINGENHGITRFMEAYRNGEKLVEVEAE